MLIPANRIWTALNEEFAKLQAYIADSSVDGSAAMSIANALQLLFNRETGGVAALHARAAQLDAVLARMQDTLSAAAPQAVEDLAVIRASLHAMKDGGHALPACENAWRDALVRLQAVVASVNAQAALPASVKAALARELAAWESAYLLAHTGQGDEAASTGQSTEITRENLSAYLQDRFDEPGLRVSAFQPLAGGYGKQTVLFDVEGKALSGSFVMRRDIGSKPSVANDCHLIRDEFPVIKAAHARGFPAPDAVWLDTAHRLLPGGDFIVMRRSPGKLPGNFFGARSQVPASLASSLADVMAQLHTMQPLTELGDLTESICTQRWNLSRGECTALYIRSWYELYLKTEHTPSPALTAIYGWLLDNVPMRAGRPSLLHGDIGFHNFLFDDDRLSAVLDWEFAHVGDPAEELGYVSVTVGGSLDWAQLMQRYIEGGGEPVDDATMRFFKVWAYARNATGANLLSTLFSTGHAADLKLAILPVAHIPHFIRGAQALIDERA
ncbi:phosphotransferase [Paraburkholderia unamae]|uniref:Phosphotransferase family enzyme n=1 Tax=Paraburkholderia unamae TaxID=219649 RepID=A0ABX5KGM3_9BURK|nr:phosphotransferase [Paraburkholderia unamae]PVX75654.1 phosphotransferase family enzyme [Paraburkholderia unamae]